MYDMAMNTEPTDDSAIAEKPRKRGFLRRTTGIVMTLILVVIIVAAGLVLGSFIRFSANVISMRPPAEMKDADGIVVLTGGAQRINQAVRLLDDGAAHRLLISGVYPATTGAQIQQLTSAEPALFECCVDIGHDAIDTRGNANEAAQWVNEHEYEDVIVVTSNYHMPRSLMELERADGQTRFIPYPVIDRDYGDLSWIRDRMVLNLLVSEYGKFIVARFRQQFGPERPDGLRSSITATESVKAKQADLANAD